MTTATETTAMKETTDAYPVPSPKNVRSKRNIEGILEILSAGKAPPQQVEMVKNVLEPYFLWLDYCEENKVKPNSVISLTASLMASQAMELILRLTPPTDAIGKVQLGQAIVNSMSQRLSDDINTALLTLPAGSA